MFWFSCKVKLKLFNYPKMSKPDIRTKRIPVELRIIKTNFDNHGITCEPKTEDDFTKLEAIIPGPKDSPYERGKFRISIEFMPQYPFLPPMIKFVTPVFHPNIDNTGKICLDVLQMPPKGSYNPALTLESILLSIQLLLSSPNPDDPLHENAADMYKYNREKFIEIVKEHMKKYAIDPCGPPEAKRFKKAE